MTIKHVITTLCVFATLLTTSVHATVIDFEDVDVGTPDITTCEPLGAIISGNFAFTSDFDHCAINGVQLPIVPDNGTQFLLEGGNLSIFALDGLPFSVSSLDLSTSLYTDIIPNRLTLTGVRMSGATVSITLSIDDLFRTYQLENFKDLVLLSIGRQELSLPQTGPGYFNLDNLVVEAGGGEVPPTEPLPLPATLPLSAAALAAVALARRRR